MPIAIQTGLGTGMLVWLPTIDIKLKPDIERIVKTDPRVQLEDINLTILDHTIQAEVKIKYLLLNSTDTLFLEYVSNNTDSE